MDPVLCSGKVDKLPINVTVNHPCRQLIGVNPFGSGNSFSTSKPRSL